MIVDGELLPWSVANLRILLGEFLVELFDFVQQDLQLVSRRQDGHPDRRKEEKLIITVPMSWEGS